jgi:hypothetical protein
MSQPATKVELGLTLVSLAPGVKPFVLNSVNDGVLGQDQIAGLQFFDVTQYVKSVSVVRGKSKQFDYFNAGSASVLFDNRGRQFDPINEDSPYYPEVKPRRLIRISTNDQTIFYGLINDWDIEYDINNNDVASISCSDLFSVLSNMNLSASTPSAQKTGARVNYVLDRPEVSYVGPRQIDVGVSDVGAYPISANTGVMTYLRQVERSEQGALFVSADGKIVFRERNTVPQNILTFADDGTGIPYMRLTNLFGDEFLYNRIVVQSPVGSAVTVSDTESIIDYQTAELSWTDLLNNSTAALENIADFALNSFSEPRLMFDGFTVQLAGLVDADVSSVLDVELTDSVLVVKTFPSGVPLSYSQYLYVSGVSHNISPDSHTVSFKVEKNNIYNVLVLGNSIFGVLDSSALSF